MIFRSAALLLLLLQPVQAVPPCCLVPQAAGHVRHADGRDAAGHGSHVGTPASAEGAGPVSGGGALASMPPGAPCEAVIARTPALRERIGEAGALALPARREGLAVEHTVFTPRDEGSANLSKSSNEARFPLRL